MDRRDIRRNFGREFGLLWDMLGRKRQEECLVKLEEGDDLRHVIIGEILDYDKMSLLDYRKVDREWIRANAVRKGISTYDSLVEFVEYALYMELPTSIVEDGYIGWSEGHLLSD